MTIEWRILEDTKQLTLGPIGPDSPSFPWSPWKTDHLVTKLCVCEHIMKDIKGPSSIKSLIQLQEDQD